MKFLIFLIVPIFCKCCEADGGFIEKFAWKTIDYEFPTSEERQIAKDSGIYIPGNSFISSIEIWEEYMYLAMPRLKLGVPFTLNYINISEISKSPTMKPFPSLDANYNLNKSTTNSRMTSIYSVRIDLCNRLWAIDSGILNELDSNNKRIETPPILFIYNVVKKSLIRKYIIKEKCYNNNSKFRNLIVDVSSGNCENAFTYIADSNYGLLVYSWETNDSYRIDNNYFSFEPIWGNFKTTHGILHQLSDGILGLTLSMPNKDGYRELFFQPLVGISEYRISTYILRNRTLSKDCFRQFFLLGNRGNDMQSSASVLDLDTGVLFYTTIIKNGIACWNSFRGDSITPDNQGIINEFDEINSYPADIKLDKNGTLWVLTNKMIDFIYEKEEYGTPYHIYYGYVRNLIKNTPCKLL